MFHLKWYICVTFWDLKGFIKTLLCPNVPLEMVYMCNFFKA
jgi:hypothetical protein